MRRLLAAAMLCIAPMTAHGFSFGTPPVALGPWTSANAAQVQTFLNAIDDCSTSQVLLGAGDNTAPTCQSTGTGILTFIGTPSSANLAAAVTGETGSGALVFGTSPTLVTPNLGTPSAITLTNATGLPIATGVSGLATGIATVLETPSSANLAAAITGETGTGALVFATDPVFAGSIQIPNGAGPVVNAAGELAHDTSADQLIFGATPRVLTYVQQECAVVEDLAASDDSFEFWMAPYATTITSVGCRCRGTCTTPATFTLEDRGGSAMTITGTNPTCATTGNATYAAVTAGGGLVAGEGLAFDVTNTPNPETDTYTICVTRVVDRQ